MNITNLILRINKNGNIPLYLDVFVKTFFFAIFVAVFSHFLFVLRAGYIELDWKLAVVYVSALISILLLGIGYHYFTVLVREYLSVIAELQEYKHKEFRKRLANIR